MESLAVDQTEAPAPLREKPDGHADPLGEAGWYLERERVKHGVGLEGASEATGIHAHHLDAIEQGDLSRLPERAEALSMLGHYANYLGFEAEPLMRHLARFMPRPRPAPPEPHPANPAPLTSAKIIRFGRMPKLPHLAIPALSGGAGSIVASLFGAVLLFGGAAYYLNGSPGMGAAPVVAEMPAANVTVDDEPMPDTEATANIEPAVEEGEAADLDGLGEFIEEQTGLKSGKDPAVEAAAEDPVPPVPGGREFGDATGKSRVTLKAKAPVWVRIEDGKGNVVMTQMLMAGDIYRVPSGDDLVAIARDGGLIAYLIDGREKGVLGTPGEILVGEPLALKKLERKG